MPSPPPPLEFASEPVEAPIRAELFGIERLEQHGESLAAAQPILSKSITTIDVGLAGGEATPGTAPARHPVRMDSEALWKLATPAIVPVATALLAFRA